MIAHVVLYEIRPDLDPAERERLERTVRTTLRSIPSVRRWVIGQRTMIGASYEALMQLAFEYAAVVEFADAAGLRDYLEHPLHDELARLFWSCSERTLVFDYEIKDTHWKDASGGG
jgi:Stress responsive A/B Barrel Domain